MVDYDHRESLRTIETEKNTANWQTDYENRFNTSRDTSVRNTSQSKLSDLAMNSRSSELIAQHKSNMYSRRKVIEQIDSIAEGLEN